MNRIKQWINRVFGPTWRKLDRPVVPDNLPHLPVAELSHVPANVFQWALDQLARESVAQADAFCCWRQTRRVARERVNIRPVSQDLPFGEETQTGISRTLDYLERQGNQ